MKREKAFHLLCRLVRGLSNLQVIGKENVPQNGAALVVVNHVSRLDTPFLMCAGGREDVIPMVAREYQHSFFLGWILNLIHVIWVTRGEYDFEAFRTATDYLNKGWVVGLAPEGRRSRDGLLHEGKPGSALLAYKMGTPLLPTAVTGTDKMSRFASLKKMNVTVEFGPLFCLPEKVDLDNKAWLQLATDEIMCQIAAILPLERRGFYANYPRVQEIIAEQQLKANRKETANDPH